MAICGSRMQSLVTVQAKAGGARTGLIWWMNDGTTSKESTQQVANGNKSTAALGLALGPAGEVDRAKARIPALALNDRVDEAPV